MSQPAYRKCLEDRNPHKASSHIFIVFFSYYFFLYSKTKTSGDPKYLKYVGGLKTPQNKDIF